MEWSDPGYVISTRPHGETAAILTALTRDHGRHAGMVRGGTGRRMAGVLQPGNLLQLTWRGRLEEHLGTYTAELVEAGAAPVLERRGPLACLEAACALVQASLPEREPHPALYDGFEALMTLLDTDAWATGYIKFELGLLGELGFGLDLSTCAATGVTEDLVYVSPKSARAVSRDAGEPYRDKLLPLPGFIRRSGEVGDAAGLKNAFQLTGYFIERHLIGDNPRARDVRARVWKRLDASGAPNDIA